MKWNSYKTSRFNYLINTESGNGLLFNTLRLSLLEIEKDKAKLISTWEDEMPLDDVGKHFTYHDLKVLSENYFIVKKDFDESTIIEDGQKYYKNILFEKGDFQLLVNTTNNCNMCCSYCFEGEKKVNKLSEATIELISHKIKQEIENPQAPIKTFSMIWFGGEPLLNQKAIEQLSSNLISICEQHNIQYTARIITNGTLLSSSFCQKMSDYKILHVQISIDGDEFTHNVRRPLYNNKMNSYEKIMNNISNIPSYIHIGIRIHADKEVIKRIPYLLDDLERRNIWPQNANRITLQLAQKMYYDNADDKDAYLNKEEYFLAEYQFRLLRLYRYNDWAVQNNKLIAKLRTDYPQLTFPICSSASGPYSMAIDDMGFIHRCWENVNVEETRIQHIDDYYFNYEGYEQWKNYKKTDHAKCKSCKVLPICDYGCIYRFMKNYELNCTKWKYMLPFYIKNYYHQLKKNNESEIESSDI